MYAKILKKYMPCCENIVSDYLGFPETEVGPERFMQKIHVLEGDVYFTFTLAIRSDTLFGNEKRPFMPEIMNRFYAECGRLDNAVRSSNYISQTTMSSSYCGAWGYYFNPENIFQIMPEGVVFQVDSQSMFLTKKYLKEHPFWKLFVSNYLVLLKYLLEYAGRGNVMRPSVADLYFKLFDKKIYEVPEFEARLKK